MTTQDIVKQWHWWTAWTGEEVERWLEGKAAQGWHLTGASWNILRFAFRKGVPARVRYFIDYRDRVDLEYTSIYEDAGWELAYRATGWLIWRMPYEGERPEMYTDTPSLISHNQRMMTTLLIALFCQFPLFSNVLHGKVRILGPLSVPRVLWSLYAALMGFILYGIAKLALNIQKLKARGL